MKKSQLKQLINEVIQEVEYAQLEQELAEAFDNDIKRLEETLIAEGFGDVWNKIKQKGSELAQGAKNALLKPLLKLIIDKIAKSDPQGMAKLANAAKTNPKSIANLMSSPQVQAKQKEVSQELKSITEILSEDEHEELFQEYVDLVLKEARVLSNDPRNVKRRELAAQKRKAKTTPAPEAAPAPAAEKPKTKPKSVPNKGNKKGQPKNAPNQDKGEEGKSQSLIQKVYGFAKKYPKISAVAGVALLGVVIAAAVGSGGVIPLITSTLASSATGALSGAVGGGVISGVKDAGSQYFKSGKVNWKQAGQAALQGAKTGAKYGAISGATGNIAGKAIAGVGKMATWAGNAMSAGKGAKDAAGKAAPQDTGPTSHTPGEPPQTQADTDAFVKQRMAAIQAATQEKALNAVNYVKQHPDPKDFNFTELQNILGSLGQGASRNKTQAMLNDFKFGRANEQQLLNWFNYLARQSAYSAAGRATTP